MTKPSADALPWQPDCSPGFDARKAEIPASADFDVQLVEQAAAVPEPASLLLTGLALVGLLASRRRAQA